jgi:hypothetical protein
MLRSVRPPTLPQLGRRPTLPDAIRMQYQNSDPLPARMWSSEKGKKAVQPHRPLIGTPFSGSTSRPWR